MNTTLLIDCSVFAHQLHGIMGEYLQSKHFDGIIKAQLLYLQSGEWLGELKPTTFQTILCYDHKPYWRTEYLKRPEVVARVPRKLKKDRELVAELQEHLAVISKYQEGSHQFEAEYVKDYQRREVRVQELAEALAIHYKAGRKFPEASFTKLKKVIANVSGAMEWTQLGEQSFEADDIAATVVRINRNLPVDKQHRIILVTVDTDWLGLLGQEVDWFCMYGWYPRLRTWTVPNDSHSNYGMWCQKRLGMTFSEPRELWDFKAANGDKSDNLPSGSPLGVIDLLNPPREFQLWNRPSFSSRVENLLLSPKYNNIPDTKLAVRYLQQLGMPTAVRPYSPLVDSVPVIEVA